MPPAARLSEARSIFVAESQAEWDDRRARLALGFPTPLIRGRPLPVKVEYVVRRTVYQEA